MKITQERLKERLIYYPTMGLFFWKTAEGKQRLEHIGQIAGSFCGGGCEAYVRIKLDGVNYPAHRLAWLYMTGEVPPPILDHINGRKWDNRFENLRTSDQFSNQQNVGLLARNTSGFKGVGKAQDGRAWRARVSINGKRIQKNFRTAELANAWVCAQRADLHGEFANHGLSDPSLTLR